MWYLVEKAVGAQINIASSTLPAKAQDFLHPTRDISTWDVLVTHPNSNIVDNLIQNRIKEIEGIVCFL